ncbi:MAG: hypothetical protein LUI14_07460 [Lachnospiraceae bacterium]|nr:hypothetical protein [Lachnospiraceae bacterium]
MQNKTYQLSYLPLFEQDLLETVDYISNVLQNEDAADRLIDDIDEAIMKRLDNPLAFEPYHSFCSFIRSFHEWLHRKQERYYFEKHNATHGMYINKKLIISYKYDTCI